MHDCKEYILHQSSSVGFHSDSWTASKTLLMFEQHYIYPGIANCVGNRQMYGETCLRRKGCNHSKLAASGQWCSQDFFQSPTIDCRVDMKQRQAWKNQEDSMFHEALSKVNTSFELFAQSTKKDLNSMGYHYSSQNISSAMIKKDTVVISTW